MKPYPDLYLNKNYAGVKIVFKRIDSSGHSLVPAMIAPMGTPTFIGIMGMRPIKDKDTVWIVDDKDDTTCSWIQLSQIVYYDHPQLQTLFGTMS